MTHSRKTCHTAIRYLLLTGLCAMLVTGCSSRHNVPFNIQSDPLGAYVMFQIKNDEGAKTDWIYLGNTPLITTRQYSKDQLQNRNSVVLRVMKEGFFDQTKVYKGESLRDESKEKGRVFWNPRLVKSQ